MARTFDRISSFLTSPSAKLKFYNDQEIETLLNKDLNKFLDVSTFSGRIIGLPSDAEGASFVNTSENDASSYTVYVYVRLDEIDEYFLPDPIDSKITGLGTLDLIMSHPVATVPTSIATGAILLGSKVECSFDESPGNHGKQRNLVVKRIITTDDADSYREKIVKKLGSKTMGNLEETFSNTQSTTLGTNVSNEDFAGRYGEAPAPVKRFLDDLVRLIKENKREDLLPINVGSLYRSLEDQAQIMWNNVVKKYQADGIEWFKSTYGPIYYKSALSAAVPGNNYGFTAPSKDKKLGYKLRKTAQYSVKLILEEGIKGNIDEKAGVAAIAATYKAYKTNYKVMPSRHNAGEAVDIRTNANSRKQAGGNVYSTEDKRFIEKLAKKSEYCLFANIESLNKSGEHLHCSASPAEGGGGGE
tara:strand:- start:485 stop:1729 length:1245 start_codon:yes stop_codon:yes gene_type:complete